MFFIFFFHPFSQGFGLQTSLDQNAQDLGLRGQNAGSVPSAAQLIGGLPGRIFCIVIDHWSLGEAISMVRLVRLDSSATFKVYLSDVSLHVDVFVGEM